MMIDRAPVSKALQELIAKATGRPCGLGVLPLVGGQPAPVPYTVLYPLGGSVGGAPLADASEDADLDYQVTAVAARTDQAEWIADRTRNGVVGRTASGAWQQALDTPGVDVWARELSMDKGVEPQTGEGIVAYVQRYRLRATGGVDEKPSPPATLSPIQAKTA
ncbi:hypothetical protein ACGFRG_05625 [Streptomyces sp. NPDC048696]|uniref:hypothetical protein n=1 Tax=Streptomyces sp. NPDC048696 TaxID=3365585 RepID=UPI00371F0D75